MYNNFNENGSGLIHYSTYQKVVKSMNTSFAKSSSTAKHVKLTNCMNTIMKQLGLFPVIDMEKLSEKGLKPPSAMCTKCKS